MSHDGGVLNGSPQVQRTLVIAADRQTDRQEDRQTESPDGQMVGQMDRRTDIQKGR